MQREAAFSENGASADAKMLAAITAPERHRLEAGNRRNRQAATVGARDFAVPAVALEIRTSRFLIWKALEKLIEADGFRLAAHET